MVQAESAAKIIEPGKVYTSDGVLLVNTTVERPLASGAPTPAKNCRPQGTAVHKERLRGMPGGPCQLNLDVLFLVRGYSSSLFFRPFADRRDGTRLPYTSTR